MELKKKWRKKRVSNLQNTLLSGKFLLVFYFHHAFTAWNNQAICHFLFTFGAIVGFSERTKPWVANIVKSKTTKSINSKLLSIFFICLFATRCLQPSTTFDDDLFRSAFFFLSLWKKWGKGESEFVLPHSIFSIPFRIILQVRFSFGLTKRTKVNSSFYFLQEKKRRDRGSGRARICTSSSFNLLIRGFKYDCFCFTQSSIYGILCSIASIPFKHLLLWPISISLSRSLCVCVNTRYYYSVLYLNKRSQVLLLLIVVSKLNWIFNEVCPHFDLSKFEYNHSKCRKKCECKARIKCETSPRVISMACRHTVSNGNTLKCQTSVHSLIKCCVTKCWVYIEVHQFARIT